MKNIVAICLLLLTAGISTGQDQSGGSEVRNRFEGAWRLAWLERPGADGKVHRVDCSGIFVFTRDGHASVQVMERDPETQAATGSQQYSAGGYEASWGTYKVNESAHTFTFHIQGAGEIPNWQGPTACVRVLGQTTDRQVNSLERALESCLGALLKEGKT